MFPEHDFPRIFSTVLIPVIGVLSLEKNAAGSIAKTVLGTTKKNRIADHGQFGGIIPNSWSGM